LKVRFAFAVESSLGDLAEWVEGFKESSDCSLGDLHSFPRNSSGNALGFPLGFASELLSETSSSV
jgi:hypothetical protein